MDTFEYLAVLVSIVVGLGLTHILSAIGRVISRPSEQKLFWVHSIWAFYVLVSLVYFWWFELGFRDIREWSGALYAFVVLYAIALYLLSVIVVPTDPQPDYRSYYFSRRRWILGFLLAIQCIDMLDTYLKSAALDTEPAYFLAMRGVLMTMAAVGMVTQRVWYHGLLAVLFTLVPLGSLLSRSTPG